MEFWFSELHSPHVKFDIRVEKQLFSGESDYQRIDVFQSPEFGKFLTLNGSVVYFRNKIVLSTMKWLFMYLCPFILM